MPVPSVPKCLWKIRTAHSNQQSSGEGTSLNPHATEPHFLPISQLVVPAQPKPRKNKDFEAIWHHAHPGELVIPAAPKTAVNQVATASILSMLFLPSEPKASHSCLDSVQSAPGLSNPISAPDVFNKPEDINMDYVGVDPSPSQINPADLCVDPTAENRFTDTLAAWSSYQATPDPRKIDYKEALDDPLKRAMEDYQRMFSAACKHF
ncbi:hypothetical protein PAXRUDRAFT_16488 [Paxillus rubicundulus Ve08.2h10]|uniref:Uncharacterized protein n=1 Tax=Paxillus rubicundulus Ve08.2h10 TaxID=930991 RepID=A0A0D0CUK9_9AGAM|nr:hypothetical protein PAXRUDRAFT_16488 [Paxillus rubicundulus Ve08.2h10]